MNIYYIHNYFGILIYIFIIDFLACIFKHAFLAPISKQLEIKNKTSNTENVNFNKPFKMMCIMTYLKFLSYCFLKIKNVFQNFRHIIVYR